MKQLGNKLDGQSLQPFLDSADNAAAMGQRQFFTPPGLAKALFLPLSRLNVQACVDLQHGNSTLLDASGAEHRLGIDIDARFNTGLSRYQADTTRWYPLAMQAGFRADLITLNPPFSLTWYADRLGDLATSTLPGISHAFRDATNRAGHIDSTAATLLMALTLLSDAGEGFMVCNASTARRLLGDPGSSILDPSAPLSTVRRYVWTWLEIPGAIYEGQHHVFDTAVLYFSASHGRATTSDAAPFFLTAPSADPGTVQTTLAPVLASRSLFRRGRSVTASHESSSERTVATWKAIRDEIRRTEDPNKSGWNIWLHPDGTIARDLTTFQRLSIDTRIIEMLNDLEGKHPAALVIQKPTRMALQEAVNSGIWRVHPAVTAAVRDAIARYHSVRAPFYPPNPVKSLGYLDEESAITCSKEGIPGIHVGDTCELRTWIEDTAWAGERLSLTGKKEELAYKGRELVVEIKGNDGTLHQFHYRRDEDLPETEKNEQTGTTTRHYPIEALTDHFEIPVPTDIAQLHPQEFQAFTAHLHLIEDRINSGLSAITGEPLPVA